MESTFEETPDVVCVYTDDGDLMRALGCLTYEAAHFERNIDRLYRAIASIVAEESMSKAPAKHKTDDKISRCIKALDSGELTCPNLDDLIEHVRGARALIKQRDVAIHGCLYQDVGSLVMRYITKHTTEPTPTSSAEMYDLANAMRVASLHLYFIATYGRATDSA